MFKIFKRLIKDYGTVTTIVLISTNIARADFVSMPGEMVDRYYSGDLMSMEIGDRQAPNENDNAVGFVYRQPISPSLMLQQDSWQSASALARPFNDSYWPMYKGIVAYRYMDRDNIPKSKSWSSHYAYYQSHPAEGYLASDKLRKKLSPSEKYDLFIGSPWNVTHHLWSKGAEYLHQTGHDVPTWFGICHGWAASSHMGLPLPLKSVTVTGANGQVVTFSPSDLRGLRSFLWASSSPQAYYIGRRCKGGSSGLGSGPDGNTSCIDNNPMSWHLAVTHRMGRDGDSMVMDSANNAEVWNYAVDSYYFRYFNPKTLRTYRDWRDAVVRREEFPKDSFARLRTPQTIYIVGVAMDVFYPSAVEPRESTSEDRLYQNQSYVYDLELNDKFEIIGGEWHTNDHPDFLWTFAYGARALSKEDMTIADPAAWAEGTPLPADWATLAQKAAKRGELMGNIIEHLVAISQQAAAAEGGGEDEETEL